MRESLLCPQCGKSVPADAPQRLCPACMMHLGFESEVSEQRTMPPTAPNTSDAATLPPKTPVRTGDETVAPPVGGYKTEPNVPDSRAARSDIPGYEILGELGRGGMGVVYKAKHKKLGRLVALKMILAGGHAGEAELARFRTEAEAIARVKHANIIQIYEIGEHEGKPYFSLEFCAGGSLAQKIDGTPMQPKEAARLVEKLARGMEAAHQEEVIHRDLKPANVLLARDGTPKITDFGLAKKLDDAGQTQSGAIMGTPSYMAPEQAEGKGKEMGPPADIYALGAILYELLTGRPPFKAATPLDTILQVVSNEPVPPSQLQNKMPRDLETICLKCLHKEPRKRYPSAKALAADLRRYQKGEPIQARPVGSVERGVKWVNRHPLTTLLLAIIGFVTVAGGVGITAGLGWALFEREHAIGQEKKAQAETAVAKKAREEADLRREEAETLAVRVQFDHYFSKAEERPDLALVGMASLLPKAARLKDQSLTESLRLHLAGLRGRAPTLEAGWTSDVAFSRLALSADGKIALTSRFNAAQLWDTVTGIQIGPLLQHPGQVSVMALSADGKTALTGSGDNTARLWETATGQPIGPPLQHQNSVSATVLSADGKIALTGSNDGIARLWNAATGQPIGMPLKHKGAITAAALSADGKIALTGSADLTARLWETATGTPIGAPLQHKIQVFAVALSADGKIALTGGIPPQLWEAATGKPIGPPLQHFDAVIAVALSPDGKIALTGSNDETARLWDVATAKPIGPPLQHQGEVQSVALSADGKSALTGSFDKTARLWETSTGKAIGPPLQHESIVTSVSLSADGKTALTRDHKSARLWKAAADKPIGPALLQKGHVDAIALSSDGSLALTGSRDKTARLWETATGKPIGPPLLHPAGVGHVALSADGKTAMTSSYINFTVGAEGRLWEPATGKAIGPPLSHKDVDRKGGVPADLKIALSADGTMGLTGSNTIARMWDAATGQTVRAPLMPQAIVFAVALSADGKKALIGTLDGKARLWDTATGNPISPQLPHQDTVWDVALSADGKIALAGTSGGTAQSWDTATGKPIGPPLLHQGQVYAVALTADGKVALTRNRRGAVRLWEPATGKPIGPPLDHSATASAISADGKFVMTSNIAEGTRRRPVPQPVSGDPERIVLWSQVITGIEVDDLTAVRVLDAATWQQRRQRLQELGGPPEH